MKKKRLLSLVIAVAMIFGSASVLPSNMFIKQAEISASAETFISGDYEYEVLEDKSVKISSYSGDAANLTVPEYLDGKKVTEIGAGVLKKHLDLISVTIPDTVTTIGENAFEGCSSLSKVRLSTSIKKLDSGAFAKCNSLTSINIPKSLEECSRQNWDHLNTAYGPFAKCDNLKEVLFENGIKQIPSSIFTGCTGIVTITIPDSVTTIGNGAFMNATNLRSVAFSNKLEKIDASAFSGCTNLEKIEFPDTVTTIGENAFEGCSSLSKVRLSTSIKKLDSGAFAKCNSLTSINIPKSLEECSRQNWDHLNTAYGPFAKCDNLKEVLFENGIKQIPSSIFTGCTGIETITIPNTVTIIGDGAFMNATGLKSIAFSNSLEKINSNAFSGCTKLNSLVLPKSITTIGSNAFSKCENLIICCNYFSSVPIYCIDNNIPIAPSNDGLSDNSNLMIDRNKTLYDINVNGATGNGYVAVGVKYSVKGKWSKKLSNQKIVCFIPRCSELIEESLTMDGKPVVDKEYKYDDKSRKLTIYTNKDSADIVYNIRLKSKDEVVSYAYFSAYKEGKIETETIAVINEMFNGITINAPERISSSTFTVSGIGPLSKTIDIYIDDKKVASASTAKTGGWYKELTLKNPISNNVYMIKAVSTDKYDNQVNAGTSLVYKQNSPLLKDFKIEWKENGNPKSCNLLESKGVRPLIYYSPNCKFKFEVKYDNPASIDKVYVTSTRNNESRSIEAKYNAQTGTYITDGFFDENNHAYVPGALNVEYTEKMQEVKADASFDLNDIRNKLGKELQNTNISYTDRTDNQVSARIDLSPVFKDVNNAIVDASVSYIDLKEGTSVSDALDTFGLTKNALSYIVPEIGGNKYVIKVDWSDPKNFLMVAYDTSKVVDKVYTYSLNMKEGLIDRDSFIKQFDKAQSISTASKALGFCYSAFSIYEDDYKLKQEIMSSSSIKNKDEALRKADELKYDRYAFTALITVIPLLVAGPAMPAASILFSSMLSIMSICSGSIFDFRAKSIKEEKIRVNWAIDPSGIVVDKNSKKPIDNAKVTAYYIPADDSEEFFLHKPSSDSYGTEWEAKEYEQSNPLYTNADGKYAWDVPEGWWRVKCEKEGYKTKWTDWMPVPPLQTDVDIELERISESVTISDSVTSIGDWEFYGCTSLTSVNIPGSVTSIGHCAFYDCTSLKSITIPGNVTSIGDNAFGYYYDQNDGNDKKVDGFTIYGVPGSAAETYAKENGFKFIKLDVLNGWNILSTGKRMYYKNGIAVTGKQKIDNKWYYFNADGIMQTGWQKIDNKWYFFSTDGIMQTGWQKLSNTWYFFNTSGIMVTGWQKLSNTWYFFNTSGAMVTGWQKIGNTWYFFNTSGAMVTGWQKLSNKWYFFNSSGAMVTGWQKLSNTWYFFNTSGAMVTGWQKLSNKWYYFNTSGAMVTGWQKISNKWYFFESSGAMLANTSRKIGGKTYKFNASGACTNP